MSYLQIGKTSWPVWKSLFNFLIMKHFTNKYIKINRFSDNIARLYEDNNMIKSNRDVFIQKIKYPVFPIQYEKTFSEGKLFCRPPVTRSFLCESILSIPLSHKIHSSSRGKDDRMHPSSTDIDDGMRFDELYYQITDKSKKQYTQTWVELLEPQVPKKRSILQEKLHVVLPQIKKRSKSESPQTACCINNPQRRIIKIKKDRPGVVQKTIMPPSLSYSEYIGTSFKKSSKHKVCKMFENYRKIFRVK